MIQSGEPQIPAGDTFTLIFDVIGITGTPADLTGAQIRWVLGRSPADASPMLTKSVGAGVTLAAEVGRFMVRLQAGETAALSTGRFYHQATVTFADSEVATVSRGHLTILDTL